MHSRIAGRIPGAVNCKKPGTVSWLETAPGGMIPEIYFRFPSEKKRINTMAHTAMR